MDICDWQCQIHSLQFIWFLSTFHFLTFSSLTAFNFFICHTFPLSEDCQMSPLWHNEVHCHNRLFTLFYGSHWGGGEAMLLSCWRNVIRPWTTVNIHIPGPHRNRRAGSPSPAKETPFVCIGWRTKAVTVGFEQRGMWWWGGHICSSVMVVKVMLPSHNNGNGNGRLFRVSE